MLLNDRDVRVGGSSGSRMAKGTICPPGLLKKAKKDGHQMRWLIFHVSYPPRRKTSILGTSPLQLFLMSLNQSNNNLL